MSEHLFSFECLPNEILIEIFKNFDIQDLFQAFYNLNLRLNTVLRSTNSLSFTISKNNYNDFKQFDFSKNQISSLIITSEIHVDLQQFPNLRCLMILTPTFPLVQQMNTQTFPMLEHLTIKFPGLSVPYTISGIVNKIFSNQLSHLQSCHLPKAEAIAKNEIWTQVPTIRILKVGVLNLPIYKAILASCPNLYLFQFIKSAPVNAVSSSEPHLNLKRMIIELPLWCTGNLFEIDSYLSQVPNLEQLTIHHTAFGTNTKEYLTYDWLSSSISTHLSSLRRFNYYFDMFYFGSVNTFNVEHYLDQIRDDFKKIHNGKYESRLIIDQRS